MSEKFTEARLHELGVGYGLDEGGYAFENAPAAVFGPLVAIWGDPDPCYLGLGIPVRDWHERFCHVFVWSPQGYSAQFPTTYTDGDGDVMNRQWTGTLFCSDRSCNCHGHMVEGSGAAGEPDGPFWEYTGNTMDAPHPECSRCEGTGHVVAEGGNWAIYVYEPEPETTEPKFFARHSTIPHDLDPDGYYRELMDWNPGWVGLYLYPRPVQVKRQGEVYQIQVPSGRQSLVVPLGEMPFVDATGAEYPRQKNAHWAQAWAVLTFIDPEN